MGVPIHHGGSFEATAPGASYTDVAAAYLDLDAGGTFAQVGAKGPGSIGLKLRTVLAGVALTVATFTAAGAAAFAGAVTAPSYALGAAGTWTSAPATIQRSSTFGVVLQGSAGSTFDFILQTASGAVSGLTMTSTGVIGLGTATFSGNISITTGGLPLRLVPTASGTYGGPNGFLWYRANGSTERMRFGYLAADNQVFRIESQESGGSIVFATGAGIPALTLSGSQAATFAGPVSGITTLTTANTVAGPQGAFATTSTGVSYLYLTNNSGGSGGTVYLYIDSSAGGNAYATSPAYSASLQVQAGRAFAITNDTTLRFFISGANGDLTNISAGNYFVPNTSAPAGNPTGGGFLWVEAGALKYRGSAGTVTPVAPA